ncbi:MAG: AraC family transcriptional regulator [Steroidobacteraceae bacterium]
MTQHRANQSDDPLAWYEPDSQQPFAEAAGTRFVPRHPAAAGHADLVRIADGFDMVIGDLRYRDDLTIDWPGEARLKCHFRLTGSGAIDLDGQAAMPVEHHTLGILLLPVGATKSELHRAGEHEQSVTLILSAQYLAGRLGEIGSQLPEPLQRFLQGATDQYFSVHLPLRADAAAAASALLGCDRSGALKTLHGEARALELLGLSAQALIEHTAGAERPDRGLTRRDVERIHRAREVIEKRFVAPPTIGELARSVGLNEGKLMHAFKQMFGCTIFDFAQQLRMQRAKELLEQSDLAVTQVAFEVGYEYSSNFTTAFKRHFGVTPKAARDAARL